MTEYVIKLRDASQSGLLLDALKRLVAAQGIDLSVEQNGHGVVLDGEQDDDARFEATVNQIIEDAIAGKLEPMTEEEQRQDEEYWGGVGSELNLSDDDIVNLVKQDRAERRAQITT